MEAQKKLAIVDFKYMLQNFESFKKYTLVFPRHYKEKLEKMMNEGSSKFTLYELTQIYEYLEGHAVPLNPPVLPRIQTNARGISFDVFLFAKYVLVAKKLYPTIRVITDAHDSKRLLRMLNIAFSKY